MKLWKREKSIRTIAQALGMANSTIQNVLEKSRTTGALTTRRKQVGQASRGVSGLMQLRICIILHYIIGI